MYSHLGQGLISHLLGDSYTVCHVVGSMWRLTWDFDAVLVEW